MRQYLDLVSDILEHGEARGDRTGTGTLSVFGTQTRYDLRAGFPLLTTKKVLFAAVLRELLWFLRGSTNINDDLAQHTPIWNAWADENGELGPVYGRQWRKWEQHARDPATGVSTVAYLDQVTDAIRLLKTDPDSRRIVVSAWNVADLDRMRLPPCHLLFQFYHVNGRLDCQLYQRSADIALGVPFNIACYALLTMMVAQECGMTPGFFVHTIGDAHIYQNHVEGLRLQLAREPRPLPAVRIAPKPVDDLKFEDFELVGYDPHPFIKFPVAV